MFQIHCLMSAGGMLDDVMRTKLYQVARDLLREGSELRRFRTSYMEGFVRTGNKYGGIGFINGVICEAEFECTADERKHTVRYIMTSPFLEDNIIEESKWTSMEDLLKEASEADKRSLEMSMNAQNN